jgi:hypothetical protein
VPLNDSRPHASRRENVRPQRYNISLDHCRLDLNSANDLGPWIAADTGSWLPGVAALSARQHRVLIN